MEKWESFKAKMVERKKTLQERRGVMVRLETFMAQRETKVSSVDLISRYWFQGPLRCMIPVNFIDWTNASYF